MAPWDHPACLHRQLAEGEIAWKIVGERFWGTRPGNSSCLSVPLATPPCPGGWEIWSVYACLCPARRGTGFQQPASLHHTSLETFVILPLSLLLCRALVKFGWDWAHPQLQGGPWCPSCHSHLFSSGRITQAEVRQDTDPLVPVTSSEAATWHKLSQSHCSTWRMDVLTSTPQWGPCQLVQE